MRLINLKAEGYRGFKNLELKFDKKNVHVFFGENGCGKSSILDLGTCFKK